MTRNVSRRIIFDRVPFSCTFLFYRAKDDIEFDGASGRTSVPRNDLLLESCRCEPHPLRRIFRCCSVAVIRLTPLDESFSKE